MAIAIAAADKTKAIRRRYTVYVRETGTFCAAADYADLSGWNTFIALFQDVAYCEDKNTKLTTANGDTVVLDDGSEKVLESVANIEMRYMQGDQASLNGLLTMHNVEADFLLVDHAGVEFSYLHGVVPSVELDIVGGEVAAANVKASKNGDISDMILINEIPTS